MEQKIIDVYCKKKCGSLGGARFLPTNKYRCHVLGNSHTIIDSYGEILKIDKYTNSSRSVLSDYFYTEKDLRKEKLKKLNDKR